MADKPHDLTAGVYVESSEEDFVGHIASLLTIVSFYMATLLMRYVGLAVSISRSGSSAAEAVVGHGYQHGQVGHGSGHLGHVGSDSDGDDLDNSSMVALSLTIAAMLPLIPAWWSLHELIDKTAFNLALMGDYYEESLVRNIATFSERDKHERQV